jgi:hypothetical protein
MKRITIQLALAGAMVLAPIAASVAQGGPPPGNGGRGAPGAPGAPGRQGGPGMAGRGPGEGPGPMSPDDGRPDPASAFLSHTAQLKLSDAQVTKLAAIARRAGDRRTAMRAKGDSLRESLMRNRPNDNAAQPPKEAEAVRAMMEKARLSAHDDLRDALAVLTADQQATAFEMMAHRGGAGPRGPGMRRGGMQGPMMNGPMMNGPMNMRREPGQPGENNQPQPRRAPGRPDGQQ